MLLWTENKYSFYSCTNSMTKSLYRSQNNPCPFQLIFYVNIDNTIWTMWWKMKHPPLLIIACLQLHHFKCCTHTLKTYTCAQTHIHVCPVMTIHPASYLIYIAHSVCVCVCLSVFLRLHKITFLYQSSSNFAHSPIYALVTSTQTISGSLPSLINTITPNYKRHTLSLSKFFLSLRQASLTKTH